MAREHVHKLRKRRPHRLGLEVKIGAAQLLRFVLPAAQQLAQHQQVELAHRGELEQRRAIERGIGLWAEVLLAQPGSEPAAVLLALGEAIFVLHRIAGWSGRFQPPS